MVNRTDSGTRTNKADRDDSASTAIRTDALAQRPVSDAVTGNWVDQHAPEWSRPYLRLSRADRPIGYWLLLLPCLWSLFLALPTMYNQPTVESTISVPVLLWYALLFTIGAIAMRGAGCTYNDIVDRDIDAQVERTRSRPIPAGQTSVKKAGLFVLFQCLAGLAVLLQFNRFTIFLGLLSILPVLIYPFMKRITNWPQIILGAAFSWGAFMGWAAVKSEISLAPVLLYLGTMLWVLGYDTIYAHQDREDDSLIGMGSTALALGEATPIWVAVFYTIALMLILMAGILASGNLLIILFLMPAALQMLWQIRQLDIHNPDRCLRIFKSNREFGLLVLLALFLVYITA